MLSRIFPVAHQALDRMHASPDGAPPDIGPFLRPLGGHDLRHMRMLASLSGLTYYMGTRVTPRALARRHRLELISTSLACERITFQPEPSATDIASEGDGSCLSLPDVRAIYVDRDGGGCGASSGAPAEGAGVAAAAAQALLAPPAEPSGVAALANVVPFSRALLGSSVTTEARQRRSQQQQQQQQQIADMERDLLLALEQARAASNAAASTSGRGGDGAAPAAARSSSPNASAAGSRSGGSSPTSSRDDGESGALVPRPAPGSAKAGGISGGSNGSGWNAADLVAAKLGEAASAASAAALAPLASAASAASAAALGPLASAAGSLYAGGLGLMSSRLLPAAAAALLPGPAAGGSSGAAAAAAAALLPERLAGATIAGIAGMEVAASHPNSSEVKAASTSGGACPSEWFVADDARSHTRYFVIQGSDSLEHWKTNLMFEPVVFEDAALGIKVGRGAPGRSGPEQGAGLLAGRRHTRRCAPASAFTRPAIPAP
jgi:hypothetical protein